MLRQRERNTMERRQTKYRLHPEFTSRIARYGLSVIDLTELAGLSYATIYATLNPDVHPTRKGNVHLKTAWKIANAFAEKTKMSPDAAYKLLIVEAEEPITKRPRRKQTDK